MNKRSNFPVSAWSSAGCRAGVAMMVLFAVVAAATSGASASYNPYRYVATNGYDLPYWLYVPDNYDSNKSYPLMIYLHGSGNCGTDNTGPSSHPNATELRQVASQPETAAFVIVPQTANSWQATSTASQAVFELFEDYLPNTKGYNIDLNRVYVTGFSLGGIGAMSWTGAYPEKIAAIGPFAGALYFESDNETRATNRAAVATWAFSGGADGTVPGDECAIDLGHQRAYGGDPLHTTYPGAGHNDTWQRVRDEEVGLYSWMLAQRSGQPQDMSMFVGWEANSNQTTVLNGPAESVTRTDPFFVGYYGTGTFQVAAGATMTNTTGYIGAQKYGRGNVLIDGAGSRWTNQGDLRVGYEAPGTLHVANGGEVVADLVDVASYSYLTGDGLLTADVDNHGHLQPGDVAVAVTAVNVSGVNGGRRPPAFELDGTPVSVASPDGSDPALPLGAGADCGVLTINGDFTQYFGSEIDIEVGGREAGQFDALHVTGSVSLIGTLNVASVGDFMPTTGETFTIIQSDAGVLSGQFTEVTGLHLGNGYKFDVVYTVSSVMLVASEELGGDATLDGHVSFSDFDVLKANFGKRGAVWSEGDFNFDGVVDISDFVILKNNWGM